MVGPVIGRLRARAYWRRVGREQRLHLLAAELVMLPARYRRRRFRLTETIIRREESRP